VTGAGRKGVAEGNKSDAGPETKSPGQLLKEVEPAFGCRKIVLTQGDAGGERVISPHAEILIFEIAEAAQ